MREPSKGWLARCSREVYGLVQDQLTKVAEVVEACMQRPLHTRLLARAVGVAENS